MFVDATPGDTLLKKIKETEEKFKIADDIRLKIVSKSGSKLVNMLKRNNPARRNCGRNKCKFCELAAKSGLSNSNCSVNSVCYQAKCDECERIGKIRTYDGETARTAYTRSLEH